MSLSWSGVAVTGAIVTPSGNKSPSGIRGLSTSRFVGLSTGGISGVFGSELDVRSINSHDEGNFNVKGTLGDLFFWLLFSVDGVDDDDDGDVVVLLLLL